MNCNLYGLTSRNDCDNLSLRFRSEAEIKWVENNM